MRRTSILKTLTEALGLGLVLIVAGCGSKAPVEKRETVFDKVAYVEKDLRLTIPDIPRLCDAPNLLKSRIDVGDCELYVEQEGKGIPIVLLHGGPGATHHYFHPFFSKAAKFARVIYYDQRGCGISDYKPGSGYTVDQAVEDLETLKKALGFEKWVVLGHSYGGYLAQRYAMKHPESVMGLILLTAATGLVGKVEGTRQYDYISDAERQRMRDIGRELNDLVKEKKIPPEKYLELLVYNRHINGDWKRQSYYRPSMDDLARMALYEWKQDSDFNSRMSQDMAQVNLEGAFAGCPIPTLIMESKWDLTWTPDKPEVLHQNHPGSQMIVFEKSGHSPFADEPDEFFPALSTFMKSLTAVSPAAIVDWKASLEKWQKDQEDPFLVTPIEESEAKTIAEFQRLRAGLERGRRFSDASTPLKSFLTYLSALHFRDLEAIKRIHASLASRTGQWTDKHLEAWDKWMSSLDVLRAPIPPEHPEPGQVWPVYLKEASAPGLADTNVFVFWNGEWFRWGNQGGPADWRPWAPRFKKDFLELMNKK